MIERTHFNKTDIGGEILPILTTGLYRDSLDALREYIQNSIDAGASDVEVRIDPDTVGISDNGSGMTLAEARKALRLGISEKNPTVNVGFRGIGIYSAFNLCDTLEIFTKSAEEQNGSCLKFDFKTIRTQLLKDQERRKQGLPSKLYLEKLLEDSVYVERDEEKIVDDHGTKTIMSGIQGDTYARLADWKEVESYLQNTVPLPFHPEFRFGPKIQRKFEEEDYRVVNLLLAINDRRSQLYRPYTNAMFARGGKYPEKFFPLKDGGTHFGFAWVCVNDERKVLRDTPLRGLLIKKFGFSIATRAYLEPYFNRPVFNRRITGEIIIQHPNLLPNAARSDFENNSTRQEFLEALPRFVKVLSDWANKIQEKEKASDVLEDVTARLQEINKVLPAERRDKDKLLGYNVELANLEHKLKTHSKTLEADTKASDEYKSAQKMLKECKAFVRKGLSGTVQASKQLEKDVVKAIQAELHFPKGRPAKTATDLISILEGAGLQLSAELRTALTVFESECLRSYVDQTTYESLLADFKEILEERF